MKQKEVNIRAKVYITETGEMSPERNIRNVHVVYLGDIVDSPDLKVVVFKGEMFSYKTFEWQDLYGELVLVLKEGQNITPPIHIPFDDLMHIQWSTNRFTPLFTIGTREL